MDTRMRAGNTPVVAVSLILVVFAWFQACRHDSAAGSLPPVEQRLPEAKDQQPAFKGQTRAPGVKTQTPFRVDVLTSSLSYPWGMAFLPDGRMIVTEKTGSIRIVTPSGEVSDSIAGVPAVHFERDGGLLDIALDPDFIISRKVFWTFSEPYDTGYVASIASATLSKDEKRFNDLQIIYRALPCHGDAFHYGARLLFDKQGYLLACFGERYYEYMRVKAQSLNSPLGKIIRLQKDGSPAPGNAYASDPDGLPELYAIGFRDPQGMAWNPETGNLWLSDHGPRGGDEINLVKPGSNYGWPVITYGLEYSGGPVNEGKTVTEGMEQPVYYWDPAVAPSGIAFYDGERIPEWRGNLFVATLRGLHLDRLVVKDGKITGEEQLLLDYKKRIRSVAEGPDGALYVLTDSEQGDLLRITPQ